MDATPTKNINKARVFCYHFGMKYQYYIATRWRNRDQALDLVKKLRSVGKSAYFFMESTPSSEVGKIEDDPEVVMQKYEAIPKWREDKRIKNIFETDLEGLKNSEILILLLPAGKSAHMEAGIAYGLGKKWF